MKMRKLRIGDLAVESLVMPPARDVRGTVHGLGTSFTCGGPSCGGTCFETCHCSTHPDYCSP